MEIGSDFNTTFPSTNDLFFISGRVALKNILTLLTLENDICLVPNYLCDSVINCFTNVEYYKINNNFCIDLPFLKSLLSQKTFKILYVINFFGYVDENINEIKELCEKNNIVLLEDYTHNLFSEKLYGDICLCSYRKTIESPFGCIVKDRTNKLNIKQKTWIDLKYIMYNILKISGMTLKNISWLKFFWLPMLKFSENKLNDISYRGFDYINYIFYKLYYSTNKKIQRSQNYQLLNKKLNYQSVFKTSQGLYFTFPILVDTCELRNKLRHYCIQNKIYCPVYWPLYFDQQKKCNHDLSNRILCFPIDQRYNTKHMNYIIQTINNYK